MYLCPSNLFFIFIGLIMLCFISWHIHLIFKYSFRFTPIKINIREKYIKIRNEKIDFADIDNITLQSSLYQPSDIERKLSKSAEHIEFTEVFLNLKNGFSKQILFNTRASLYSALKKLKPYVSINAYIEEYSMNNWLVKTMLMVLVCLLLGLFCYFNAVNS